MTAQVVTEEAFVKAFKSGLWESTRSYFGETIKFENPELSAKHFTRILQTFPPCWKPSMTSIKLVPLPFGIVKCYMCVVFLEQSTCDYFIGDIQIKTSLSLDTTTISLKK